MTSTAILIILAILAIVIIAYFVIKKRTTLLTREKLTSPPLPIMDRIVGEHVNLPPGILAPLSGNYECIICARGGLQDSTAVALFGPAEANRRAKFRKATRTFFEKDTKLPACPNCGDAAGWALVK